MNRERFISLVKNPALIELGDTALLEEILKEYPFFQTAHLLAARCYKVADSIHLQKQIKTAAAHVTDRKVLYELIEHFNVPAKHVQETKEVLPETEVVTESSPTTEQPDKQLATLAEISAQEVAQTNQALETIAEVLPPDEEIIEVKSEPLETPLQPQVNAPVKDEIDLMLEKEMKLAVAESMLLQELEKNSSQQSEPISTSAAKSIAHTEEIKLQTSHASESKETEIEQTLPPQTEFVAWLKQLNSASSNMAEPPPAKPEKTDEKLIEAFVEKPVERVKPSKQEFYKPVNMAKQSVTDNDFFVTETLAKIYIKQGNLAKAIKVYQNLSLKNPEKNAIFAAQIKILKEQLLNKSGK
jgi:hypothetical protein